MDPRRRALLWAILVAVLFGFAMGWFARVFTDETPETRVLEVTDRLRERVRELTR